MKTEEWEPELFARIVEILRKNGMAFAKGQSAKEIIKVVKEKENLI